MIRNEEHRIIIQKALDIFWERKRKEGFTYDKMAEEAGISHQRVFQALQFNFASKQTMKALREWLAKQESPKQDCGVNNG